MQTLELTINGMSCGHCVQRVSKTLGAIQGVKVDEVQVGSARVSYDTTAVSVEAIVRALDDAGYGSSPAEAKV